MSDLFLQVATSGDGSGSASSQLTGVTAGSVLVGIGGVGNTTSPAAHTMSDGQGSYTEKLAAGVTDTANTIWLNIYLLENANAGTHNATFSSAGNSCFCVLVEIGGPTSNSVEGTPVGANQIGPGTGTDALSSGNITIAQAVTLLGFANDNSSTAGSDEPAAGTGFTSRQGAVSTNIGVFRVETKAVSTTSAATATAITGAHDFITLAIAIANSAGASAGNIMWIKA